MISKVVGWTIVASPIIALFIVAGIMVSWWLPAIIIGVVLAIAGTTLLGLKIAGD